MKNLISYLGSKVNLFSFIEEIILNKIIITNKKLFIDLCSETCSVSKFIQKNTNLDIISNDISNYSNILFYELKSKHLNTNNVIETTNRKLINYKNKIEDCIVNIYKNFILSNIYKKNETIVYIDYRYTTRSYENKFLSKNYIVNYFEDIILFSLTISNNIFILYNNEGILKEEDIKNIIKKFKSNNNIKLNTYIKEYKRFTSSENNKVIKIIWHIETIL